jgi:hypothetical protein
MMKRIIHMTLAVATTLLAGACAKTTVPPSNHLGPLRILALVADKPEASLGDTITITPYVSDFDGGGRSLYFSASVYLCPHPRNSYAGSRCMYSSPPDTVELVSQQAVTGLAAPNYTGSVTPVTFTLPATLTGFADFPAYQQFNGLEISVYYSLSTEDGAARYEATKAIRVSTNPTKNSNPVITSLLLDGAVATRAPLQRTSLSANIPAASVETYDRKDSDNVLSTGIPEHIETVWYVSEGEIDSYRSFGLGGSITWTPPAESSGRDLVIVGVAFDAEDTLDGRMGTAVKVVELPAP